MKTIREIKFRGRTPDDRWAYGFYVERDGYDKGMIYDRRGLGLDVDPKTVGQYTSLKDKNGKEIYEGDIVIDWCTGIEGEHTSPEVVEWDNWRQMDMLHNGTNILEVIGNIHENPELLKG